MNRNLAKIKNAKLEATNGHFTFSIIVDYEDCGTQNIGGVILDKWDDDKNKRVGTAFGCEMIRRILTTLEVDDFSAMQGMIIWVYGEGDGLDFKPRGIQPLNVNIKDKDILMFAEVYNEFNKP